MANRIIIKNPRVATQVKKALRAFGVKFKSRKANPLRYKVKTQYGYREYGSKSQAISHARKVAKDGWTTYVIDMQSDSKVWESSGSRR